MTPEQVIAAANVLRAAIVADDEKAGTEAALDLFIGMALNLARLAHPAGDPA